MNNFKLGSLSRFLKFNFNLLCKVSSVGLLAAASQTLITTEAIAGTALTTKETFSGKVNYTVTGGTLRSNSDENDACSLNSTSSAQLTGIPSNGTVRKAYLYWSGSGSTVDDTINFDGTSLTADRTYTDDYASTYDFFQGVKDVTNMVASKGNGTYQFSGLSVDDNDLYCSVSGVLSGWSLIVIYDDPSIDRRKLNTIELYEGFTASRNQSVDYTLDNILVASNPVATFSMLIWEGDESLGGSNEFFSFNDNTLSDSYNPANNQFNSSINTLGLSNVYGVDLDTFDVSNYVSAGDTSVTGTISTNNDLVLQGAALVMVTDELANESPTAQPDTIITDEDTEVTYNLIDGDSQTNAGQDSDPEGDILTLTKFNVGGTEYSFATQDEHQVTMPSGATLTVNKNGNISYNPDNQFESLNPGESAPNPDTFTYTVGDSEGGTGNATATVNVNGVADDPVAVDDTFTTDEDTAKRIHVLRNDSDPNTNKEDLKVTKINNTPVGLNGTYTLESGAVLTVKNVAQSYKSRNGDYTLHYNPTTSNSLNYLNLGQTETETFTYTVSDPEGNTAQGNVTVTVEGRTDTFAD
ncbi:MAG: Ig-like domain-containing protein [Cyanobacteria bacterium P01_A01_bin.83]